MRPLALAVLLIAGLLAWWLFSPRTPPPSDAPGIGDILGGAPEEGFERALAPRPFRFPADHGAHPGFRNEWWYFTGNLQTDRGRRFGFQLVFFRNALAPGKADGQSPWRTHQTWMAHFALTDPGAGRFHAFERLSRGAAGLAGARPDPLEIWLDDWFLKEKDGRWRLYAKEKGFSLSLSLSPRRRPVPQGEAGLSRKSAAPGNASYYYSVPRLRAQGRITLDGRAHRVSGLAWLDREWGTSALADDQAGWDWFALQLDNGADLMFYRLRRKDGGPDPHSAGSWMTADGRVTRLGANDVRLKVLEYWSSPRGGRYPVRWRLRIPSLDVDLKVAPVMDNQELDLLVRYWEGAVDVAGVQAGKPVRGRGYLELAGYGD